MPPVRVEPSVPVPVQKRRIRRAAERYREQLERGDAVGRLTVPRLDLDAIVVEGTDNATLTKGPGRYSKSYVPGEGELIYIAGHRTTYGAPLARIDRMRKGDEVTLDVPYGRFVYRVSSRVIVPADDIERLRVGRARGDRVAGLPPTLLRQPALHRLREADQRDAPRGRDDTSRSALEP